MGLDIQPRGPTVPQQLAEELSLRVFDEQLQLLLQACLDRFDLVARHTGQQVGARPVGVGQVNGGTFGISGLPLHIHRLCVELHVSEVHARKKGAQEQEDNHLRRFDCFSVRRRDRPKGDERQHHPMDAFDRAADTSATLPVGKVVAPEQDHEDGKALEDGCLAQASLVTYTCECPP